MFRRDIIEKIIVNGDIAVDIDGYVEAPTNYDEFTLNWIALYRLDVNGDNPFKLINKKEYQSYIRDEKLKKLLE